MKIALFFYVCLVVVGVTFGQTCSLYSVAGDCKGIFPNDKANITGDTFYLSYADSNSVSFWQSSSILAQTTQCRDSYAREQCTSNNTRFCLGSLTNAKPCYSVCISYFMYCFGSARSTADSVCTTYVSQGQYAAQGDLNCVGDIPFPVTTTALGSTTATRFTTGSLSTTGRFTTTAGTGASTTGFSGSCSPFYAVNGCKGIFPHDQVVLSDPSEFSYFQYVDSTVLSQFNNLTASGAYPNTSICRQAYLRNQCTLGNTFCVGNSSNAKPCFTVCVALQMYCSNMDLSTAISFCDKYEAIEYAPKLEAKSCQSYVSVQSSTTGYPAPSAANPGNEIPATVIVMAILMNMVAFVWY